MNDAHTSENTARGQAGRAMRGNGRASRLLRRTFLVAFILVSGGLITSGAVELFFRYRESVEGIWALQREMAQGVAFKIQQFVKDIEKTLQASTQTPEIVTNGLTEAYRFQLIKLLREVPAITTATAVEANGGERLKVSRVQMVQPEDLGDRTSDFAFVQARKGESFFSPVYFVRHSEPYMRIAVPIERFAGSVVGVLIAEVNLKYFWEVISQIKVGKTGYAYVVSPDGDLIAHPDISLVLQKRSLKGLSQVQAALAGTPGPFVAQPNLAGQQVFPAYAFIPDLGWAVLVERPAGEAYAPLYSSMLRTGILLLLGLGFAILASLLIGRRVVRPVLILREGAARIGAGALNLRIDLRTGDELQALAEEFNHMAARLQESYAGLEQKVEERTRELACLVEELQALSEVSQAVSSTLDLQTVLTTIVTRAAQLSGANGGAIYEYDETAQAFDLRATHGAEVELMQALQAEPIPLGESALGRAALSRAPVQVPDISDEQMPVLARIRPVLVRSAYHSLLALPLLAEQRIMGGLV
ncbi:MAG: cache domain-containing protein, partial [Desulfobacterales bacterium]